MNFSSDENAICSRCGRFGAMAIAETFLCEDCIQSSGSCCPEFGREDDSDRGETTPRSSAQLTS